VHNGDAFRRNQFCQRFGIGQQFDGLLRIERHAAQFAPGATQFILESAAFARDDRSKPAPGERAGDIDGGALRAAGFEPRNDLQYRNWPVSLASDHVQG
jgi:hypothetical protein